MNRWALAVIVVGLAVALLVGQRLSVLAQPIASITLPAPGATKQLYPGCNAIALTFPNGTSCDTVIQGVTPPGVVQAMWRHSAAQNKFEGFSPLAPQASDLMTVDFLDPVWLCLAGVPPLAPALPAPPPPPPAVTQPPAPTATAVPPAQAPSPIALSGYGPEATGVFSLSEGIAVFHMTHSGSSNFAVWLLAESGERLELLANEIGPYDGRQAVGVIGGLGYPSPGNHLLDIDADGNWSIMVEQPRVTSAPTAPQLFSGSGPDVSSPFMLGTGVARFEMSHSGSSNFAVWLLDGRGERVDLLANDIGPYQGSTAVGVTGDGFDAAPGVHYLNVEADGSWTIRVTQ